MNWPIWQKKLFTLVDSDAFAGVMDFSGMSLIKLKKEEIEAQVRFF